MKNRIKSIRNSLEMNQTKFAESLCMTRSAICKIESGENSPSEQTLKLICSQFNVNEEWLRTGEGEMFHLPEDETAALVSELLEESNPTYDLVLSIMKTYQKLDVASREVLDNFILEFAKNLKKDDSDGK